MFVRKKKNPSGIISIQVIDKSRGIYKVFKTIGSSSDPKEGQKWIDLHCGKRDIFIESERQREEKQVTEYFLNNVENILLNGTQLILNVYFESDYSDELRERGFSKDGKHSQPQVVPGLLISCDGYPLSYSLFNGSQYEGRTMIPVVEDFVHRFRLEDFVVVADSRLMNSKNIALLESQNYKYIIGARIKNETEEIKQWVLSLDKIEGSFYELGKLPQSRLIIGYSEKRAKKDKYNREKGVRCLQTAYKSGTITKEHVNKRGYNKFLEISDNVKLTINQEKIREDEQWDGLKGYLTNTTLDAKQVYEQYCGLGT